MSGSSGFPNVRARASSDKSFPVWFSTPSRKRSKGRLPISLAFVEEGRISVIVNEVEEV